MPGWLRDTLYHILPTVLWGGLDFIAECKIVGKERNAADFKAMLAHLPRPQLFPTTTLDRDCNDEIGPFTPNGVLMYRNIP